jgi:hypothetical protein
MADNSQTFELADGRKLTWFDDGRALIRNYEGKIVQNLLPSAVASQQASGRRKPDASMVDAILEEVGRPNSKVFRKLAERAAKGETRAIVELIELTRLDEKAPGQPAEAPAPGEKCPTCGRVMGRQVDGKPLISSQVIAEVLNKMVTADQKRRAGN